MAGALVQTVNVLGDEPVQPAALFELHERAVTRIRSGGPRRMLEAALPRQLPDFRIRHVVMNVGEPLCLGILRPQTLRPAEIGDTRFGGDPGPRQHDDARGFVNPATRILNRVTHAPDHSSLRIQSPVSTGPRKPPSS